MKPKEDDTVARSRWRILANALHPSTSSGSSTAEIPRNVSIRRFSSFGLVSTIPLNNLQEPLATWFEYRTTVGQEMFSVLVRHPKQSFTAADLMGFNNTGNVCVWPSEETLAFFCLSNRGLFTGKSVVELGGGMTCLVSLMIAKFTAASRVLLTDGNRIAMDNVNKIMQMNELSRLRYVSARVLQWGKHKRAKIGRFDLLVCADCLFFDENRGDLIDTIRDLLSDDGIALVVAPQRGGTLSKFYDAACAAGFICELHKEYNQRVWHCHLQMMTTKAGFYDEDIHYPLLMTMSKSIAPNEIQRIVGTVY